ncbi:hypothetical protein GH714_003554 [Hevea brasiliensis]|uniref:Serine-threonine/tyrosine-protein kinase catalytic domain-containing protein n=1 Tax=Hevea brasiliensis TaxID=3981 RepID=A0A6A6N2B1_HEVBR|nr:hypothetical protein GH714_003554 [Hevea brasiliensis]
MLGMAVAVKVFNLQLVLTQNVKFFEAFDRNLIKIINSCANVDVKALVMEFMPNGNLEALLHSNSYCLDMLQRVWITGNSVLWNHVDGNIYKEEAHRRNVLERLGIRLIAEW